MSLHGKLAEVMAEVGRIPKNGYNDFHKYKYVLESDLAEAVRQRLAERGVMLYTSAEEVTREAFTITSRQGSRETAVTTVRVKFTAADGESGETFEFWGAGQGEDAGDKGIYKALTGAVKYGLMKLFLIPTGDDPEADSKNDENPGARGNAAPESGTKAGGRPVASGGSGDGESSKPPAAPDPFDRVDAALAKVYGDALRAKQEHMSGVFTRFGVGKFGDLSPEQVETVIAELEEKAA